MTTGNIICVIIAVILIVLVIKQVQGIRKTIQENKAKKENAVKVEDESKMGASTHEDINKKEEDQNDSKCINQ